LKNCSLEFIKPVCPSFRFFVGPPVTYFFAIFEPTIFQILDSERRPSIYEECGFWFFDPLKFSFLFEFRFSSNKISACIIVVRVISISCLSQKYSEHILNKPGRRLSQVWMFLTILNTKENLYDITHNICIDKI
jgi:hypothetical protein